jgi:hypothetical protein
MNHDYTIYYMIGGRGEPESESNMYLNGLDSCKKYECDYRVFDGLTGLLICRKKNEEGKFCEEFVIRSEFYIGEIMHNKVQEKHEKHMMREAEVNNAMQEMMLKGGNGNCTPPGAEVG